MGDPMSQAAGGDLLTDDFAPVNLYDSKPDTSVRRK